MLPKPSRITQAPPWAHIYGVFAILWGLTAWAEWFLTPALVDNDGGPVPYMAYVPLVLAFVFGALWITLSFALFIPRLRTRYRLAYVAPSLSYLLFLLGSFLISLI